MREFEKLYNKIIMQQLDGVSPQEYINSSEEAEAETEISIQEKIADVIVDELEDLPESEWKSKLSQIEELVVGGLTGVGTPQEQINNMEYLDFVNLVINALKDLEIIQ